MKPTSGFGFTLVELMVTLVIAGVVLRLGIVSFNNLMASTKSRAVAESIMSGLRLARAEAIQRNVPMRFQMVSSLNDNCAYANNSPLWVVSQGDVATTNGVPGVAHGQAQNHCASTPYAPPDQPDICPVGAEIPTCAVGQTTLCRGPNIGTNPNPSNCTDDPLIAYKSDGAVYPGIWVWGNNTAACVDFWGACGLGAAVVTFGPLGRVATNSVGGASIAEIVINPINGDNSSITDAARWKIQISAGNGSLRLCNPAAGASSVQACR